MSPAARRRKRREESGMASGGVRTRGSTNGSQMGHQRAKFGPLLNGPFRSSGFNGLMSWEARDAKFASDDRSQKFRNTSLQQAPERRQVCDSRIGFGTKEKTEEPVPSLSFGRWTRRWRRRRAPHRRPAHDDARPQEARRGVPELQIVTPPPSRCDRRCRSMRWPPPISLRRRPFLLLALLLALYSIPGEIWLLSIRIRVLFSD